MRITVRHTPDKGRGVFAKQHFVKGETIEQSPVIAIPAEQVQLIQQTVLRHYYFEWGENDDEGAIVLGCGLLYNHSYEPNAAYIFKETDHLIEFVALRDIPPDEEILINYHGVSGSQDPLWFDVVS